MHAGGRLRGAGLTGGSAGELGAADREFLGLDRHGDGRSSFALTPALARFDGRLYGGAAVAVAVAAAEVETGRAALWSTVQFVGSADLGARIDCQTDVLATGRGASQVRVTATEGDRVVFVALGACADERPDGFAGQFEVMPAYAPPEECPPFVPGAGRTPALMRRTDGYQRVTDFRQAVRLEPKAAGGRMALWACVRDRVASPALLGFLADMVPVSVARAGGRAGAGTSLDNTLRFGPRGDTSWVLVDLDPHLASGGYGHGTVHLWSPDGTLLATGSQTASMLLFD